jgi:regulator of sigma E protease
MTIIGFILTIIIGIGLLIFVHELGHFITAKWAKVKVEAFSLGFGPTLYSIKKGDTVYRIGLIPLGGYVKMAGENITDPDKPRADYEFPAKPPLVRARIFAAGAIMNFLFAFPACMLAYIIGLNFAVPIIGDIIPNSSEWESNLQKGDRIVSIVYPDKEVPVTSIETYRRAIIRAPSGTVLKLRVKDKPELIPVEARGSTKSGLVIPKQTLISGIRPNSGADKAGLKINDEITEINGEAVTSVREIERHIYPSPGQPVNLKIKRPKQSLAGGDNIGDISHEIIELTVVPDALKKNYYELDMDGIQPPIIGSVKTGAPGYLAGFQRGDRVLAINNQPVKSVNEATRIIKSSPEQDLIVSVTRKDNQDKNENIALNCRPGKDSAGKGYLMVVWAHSNEIGEVKPDSIPATAGLEPGDKIISAHIPDAQPVSITALAQLIELSNKHKGAPIELTVLRGAETVSRTIAARRMELQGTIGVELKAETVKEQYHIPQVIVVGFNETIDLVKLTGQLIWKMFTGDESASGMAGPIGIIQASWLMVQEGLGKFIWMLALFSINLALLNLLPVPILDGGGIMFMIIERIKGKPVSMAVQVVSQYIGLFLLLALVIFATYNDILRSLT